MITIALHVAAVSAIPTVLAAALVLADRFVSNYGECRITINDNKTLDVQGGGTLLDSLTANQIFIPSACGGKGTCGYCKVKINQGVGPVLPTEEAYLDQQEIQEGVRLSCQVKVRENMEIEIPEELLEIQQYRAVCERIRDLTHDIKEFRFRLQDPPSISYKPGQYMQLLTPAYDGNEEVYRAYSISSDPAEEDVIEFVIRLVPGGICTTYCFNHLQEGDEMSMNGPYGDFYLRDTEAPALFVAGGSGMAPLKSILHDMKNNGNQREVTYFFGGNEVRELFYTEEMRAFEKELANFTFVPVVARPEEGAEWDGETGLVTEPLERLIDDASGHEGYLCGSPGMIDAAVEVLKKQGMPEDKIYYDKFA